LNKPRTVIKILHWNQDGLAVFYKRLERGTFKRPSVRKNSPNSELSKEELFMILRGIDFEKKQKKEALFNVSRIHAGGADLQRFFSLSS
jgi:transposase